MKINDSAVITGAAAGIGFAFANELAIRGFDLILIDKNAAALEDKKAKLAVHPVNVHLIIADLSSKEEIARVANEISMIDNLALLINGAGFATGKDFLKLTSAEHLAMIDVHISATVMFCHAVLPKMLENSKGAIITISSLGGIVPGAGDILYGSTKRFLLHFTLCLYESLKSTPVRVQVLCPGYTHTNFHAQSSELNAATLNTPEIFWMNAHDVVQESLAALSKNKHFCIPGRVNRFLYIVIRFTILRKIYIKLLKIFSKLWK